ncbi:MAG TPA: peptidase dimerization domain-containing protein [Bryobacteraceae bacterium]|nr:peptidase dimerization domain-containing protein [Bryobacteraceae bacterium]
MADDRLARERSAKSVVITVGSINGGTKGNIIPDQVRMQLSVRTFDPEVRTRVLAAIARIAKAEAAAALAPREPLIEQMPGIQPVINDPELTNRLAAALKTGMPAGSVVEMPPFRRRLSRC